MRAAGPPDPRSRVLRAAEDRFRRFGYRRTSVDVIADTAEVGKGSVYLHFESKADLYLAVVDLCTARFVEAASRAMAEATSAPGRLRALVVAAAHHYEHDDLLAPSLLGHADLVNGHVAQLAAEAQRGHITALITEALREGQREGSIRAGLDPERAASVLFEIGWAIVRRHLEGHAARPLADDLETLNDIVGRGTMTARPDEAPLNERCPAPRCVRP